MAQWKHVETINMQEDFSKNHPVLTVKNGDMKKVGNVNLASDLDEIGFVKTQEKPKIQYRPSKLSVFEESSSHKENIHPEILMRMGQKINHLCLRKKSMGENSTVHHRKGSTWEGKLTTPKTSNDLTAPGESVTCPEGMELTVTPGEPLPIKLENIMKHETSSRITNKDAAFTCSSKGQNVPKLLEANSSMGLIQKGISMLESNEANPDTVQDEIAYLGYTQENNDGDNDFNDISGSEFTVPHGKLIHHNVSEEGEQIITCEKDYATNQTSNKNEKIITDSVHQIYSFPNKNAVNSNYEGPNHLNINNNELDDTFYENDGMELTVPLGKLMELKSHQVNKNANQVEEKQKELDSIDFSFPQGNIKQFKPHKMNGSAKQLQETQQEMDDIDFTVPHRKLLQLNPCQVEERVKQHKSMLLEMEGCKRENSFHYSIHNFENGAIGSVSSHSLVPEDKYVSEPKEIHHKALECLNISDKVAHLRNVEERFQERKSLMGIDLSPIPEENSAEFRAAIISPLERSENTTDFLSSTMTTKRFEEWIKTSPIPNNDSETNEGPIGSSKETSEQAFLSTALESKKFDVETWMKEETSKKWCPWKIHKLEETQWSFYVLYGIVKLNLKLKPISGSLQNKSRSVDGMELVSRLDVGNRDFDYLVVNIFLERCEPTILESLCQTTDQLPELFAFMCKEMKSLDGLHKQTTKLYEYYPVIFIDNGFTFSFGSKILMKLFWVEVNLSNWKDGCIEANDVKVINKLGNMREKDIRDILKTVKKDSNYLPRFYEEVKSFIKMLEDLE